MSSRLSVALAAVGVLVMLAAATVIILKVSSTSDEDRTPVSAPTSSGASRTPDGTSVTAPPTGEPTTTTSTSAPPPTTSRKSSPPNDSGSSTGGGSAWRLVWSDEFNGSTVNLSKWNIRDNTYLDHDKACITGRSQNLSIGGGHLKLIAQRENRQCWSQNRQYTTSYLDTIGKASWTYGAFEIRAKSPNGPTNSQGLWPAFWLRPDDGGKGEIDVTELPGGASYYRAATASIFYQYEPRVKQDYRYTFKSGYPGDGFHVYRTEWEPGVLRWYIDGVKIWQRDRSTTPWFDEVFNKPYHLRLNFQVGGWLGDPNSATAFPAEFVVDYVRIYQRP